MRVLTVFEATAYLKDLIELDPVLGDVWLRGEVTNLSTSAAGHSYFSLTSDGAQMSCVLFRGSRARVIAMPRNGDAVLAHGRVAIYEARSQYQLIVDNVVPEGIGILQLQIEDTRQRLSQEGLFAPERKRPLPEMPRAMGVVTSEHGAVWHDIQNVVARRFPLTDLVLAPSAVQGPHAPAELIAALRALDSRDDIDVIIIGRGGGSTEDLAAFSDESLARAAFACRTPVVSAVGHETDTCILDLVADVRAPTPSAAAELCVPDQRALMRHVGVCLQEANDGVMRVYDGCRASLHSLRTTVGQQSPLTCIANARQDVDARLESASEQVDTLLKAHRGTVELMLGRAALLDPMAVLRRGYAVVSSANGSGDARVLTASAAATHDRLRITFADGTVDVHRAKEQA